MKQLKIAITILSLLGIGFLGGFYTNRYLVQQKINKVAGMRYADGFKAYFFQHIQATAEQEALLSPYVDKYAEAVSAVYQESREKRQKLMNSLKQEIQPLISTGQMEKLDHFCYRYYKAPAKAANYSQEVKN